ncbi:MAG: hypothetical protein NZ805_15295 [Armatimonadetes bacterium]|nr:hypothetical protein [Armatimonadota bacterium]
MKAVTTIGIGMCLFIAAFGLKTGQHMIEWLGGIHIVPSCDYNLKAVWVVAHYLSVKYRLQFPPPLKTVQAFADSGQSILLTSKTSTYLGLMGQEGTHLDFRGILLCALDPKYSLKMAKMSQNLPYEPSYLWQPDRRTLAYCPYCGLAVLLEGKLEKRSTPKP